MFMSVQCSTSDVEHIPMLDAFREQCQIILNKA